MSCKCVLYIFVIFRDTILNSAWYEGAGTTDRRWLIPDERGSIVAVTDASGAAIAVNAYDDYGIPAVTNAGRFQYTGQAWLPEIGMYNYKARIYSPTLGRFLQTDPIGYGDGMNMYAYVGGDPVNATDPSGMEAVYYTAPTGYIYRLTGVVMGDGPVNWGWTKVGFDPSRSGLSTMAQGPSVLEQNAIGALGRFGGPKLTNFNASLLINDAAGDSDAALPQKNCRAPTQTTANTVADYADAIGTGADVVTLGAEAFGLATAPTGAGPAGAAVVAFGAGLVSRGASAVGLVANLANGNYVRAAGNAVGIVGGTLAGKAAGGFLARSFAKSRAFGNLSASQARAAQAAQDAANAAYSHAIPGC